MSGAGYIGSLAGPEFTAKVNRVLEAARAWRNLSTFGRLCSEEADKVRRELKNAIDALDAPQPSITDSDDAEKRAWATRNRASLERWWAQEDAPREQDRYHADGCLVYAGNRWRTMCNAASSELAEKIAAALNAAERKP